MISAVEPVAVKEHLVVGERLGFEVEFAAELVSTSNTGWTMDSFSRQYGSGITWCSSRVAVTVPGTLAARLRPLSRLVIIQDPLSHATR